jgi:hypothetical protein
LYIISIAVTPGYKLPFSSQTGTMKQWGPKVGIDTLIKLSLPKIRITLYSFSGTVENYSVHSVL